MFISIAVVIPSYNLIKNLKKCLQSLEETGYKSLNIIIVDNGSKPSLKSQLEKDNPTANRIFFLRNRSNDGFAKACNRGIIYILRKFSKTNYILILNNDVQVKRDFFRESLPYLRKKIELVSPIIEKTGKRGIDSMGIDYYSDGTGINRIVKSVNKYLLPAASLFISLSFAQENLKSFGFIFIPSFGSYIEDIELSLRALLMKKRIFLIPKRLVLHEGSKTINDEKNKLYLGIRNQIWTITVTWSKFMIQKNIIFIIKGQFINCLIYSIKYGIFFMVRIYCDTIRNLSMLLSLRKEIQKEVIIDQPDNLFMSNPVTLSLHIKRSRTFKRIKYILSHKTQL